MAGGVQVWRLETSASSSSASNNVSVTPHRNLSLGELIWLCWWQLPAPPTAGRCRTPLVLFTGSEDGLVSASLVTAAKGGDERPPKYLMGKWCVLRVQPGIKQNLYFASSGSPQFLGSMSLPKE